MKDMMARDFFATGLDDENIFVSFRHYERRHGFLGFRK
jgi:hypothetical protein